MEHSNFKTKICKFFMNGGQCNKGNDCTYAHGKEEMKFTPNNNNYNNHYNGGGNQRFNNNQKKVCFKFQNGNCNFGENCYYAHERN